MTVPMVISAFGSGRNSDGDQEPEGNPWVALVGFVVGVTILILFFRVAIFGHI